MQPILCTLIYIVHQGQVLMMRRRKQPNLGLWTAPGGKLEPGEAPAECARRELQEETGLVVDKLTLRAVLNDEGPQRWLMFVYFGELNAAAPRPGLIECPEGELVWLDLDIVLQMEIPAADAVFFPKVMAADSPVYEAKFFYDQNDTLLNWIDFS